MVLCRPHCGNANPRLCSPWWFFFLSGVQRLSIILAVATDSLVVLFPQALSHLYCLQTCEYVHCDWWVLISHCHFVDIPIAIRDAEHLVLCWMFEFFFFSLKGLKKTYLWQLASWKSVVFGIYFCSSHPRTLPESSFINRILGIVS